NEKGIAEHDRTVFHPARKNLVVIELRPDAVDRAAVLRDVLQVLLRQTLEYADPRRFVTLGEHDVESDDSNLVVVEQLVEQQRDAVARPGPAPFASALALEQAPLVD